MTLSAESMADLQVLVIDDQSHVRQWVRKVLNTMGVTHMTEAANGREALAAVTEPGAWFDLIVCDLRMPDRDGIETIRSFASLGLESAVAIMSIEDERVLETAGMLAELQGLRVLGTIPKPLTREKLEPLLERMQAASRQPSREAMPAAPQDLQGAFLRRELRLLYQPKITMRTGKLAGVEALVRWKHPQHGLLPPASFLPMIEKSDDFTALLLDYTLREAIALAGIWKENGRELPLAINLSRRAFDRLDLPETVESIVREAHVPPEQITLEITETHVARDAIRMIDIATRLRLKGFWLAIDDFGVGQSGLAQLQKLPFNELKIDREFVHGCAESATKRSVVEASLALARSLKMTSVAEGVERRPDWNLLEELGCDVMQGYFIARPMSDEGLDAWLAQWTLRDR